MDTKQTVAAVAVIAIAAMVGAAGGVVLLGGLNDGGGQSATADPTTTTTTTSTTSSAAAGAADESTTSTPSDTTSTTTPTTATTTTSTSTPTSTSASDPTTSATTTTATPSSTTTSTTATTSEPSMVTVGLGEWGDVETQGTTLGVQATSVRTTDAIAAPRLTDEYEDDGALEAPEGQQWVILEIRLRNIGAEPATVARTQWSMTDLAGTTHAPDAEAMRKTAGTLERHEIGANTGEQDITVIFATSYPDDATWTMAPYQDAEGATVTIDPSA